MARNIDYAWFNQNLFEDRKVRKLLRAGGSPAFVAWVRLICWCRKNADPEKLDEAGVMDRVEAEEECRDPVFIEHMLQAGLLTEMIDGRVALKDFAEHQNLAYYARLQRRNKAGGKARGRQISAARYESIIGQAREKLREQPRLLPGVKPRLSHRLSPNNPTQPNPEEPKGSSSSTSPDADEFFDEFWATYPRRVGKQDALKAWPSAVVRGAGPFVLIASARQFAELCAKEQREAKHIPHPATWLNGARWEDEETESKGMDWR